jgi:hypothetical protein
MSPTKRLGQTVRVTALAALLMAGPAAARADVVLEWNAIMLTTITGLNPAQQGYFAAIAQLAVFDAVNSITGKFRPYVSTIRAPRTASAEAAAVAAAHVVLKHFVPGRAAELDAARARSLAAIPDGPAKGAGVAVGEAAAAAIIQARLNDGFDPPEFHLPASSEPGEWQLTPSCSPAGGVFLHLPRVTPFGIRRGDQFRSDPPPSLTSDRFARHFNNVKKVGGTDSTERPQDRADVARFYAVVLGNHTWNPVATQIATARGGSLSENARALALLNMAIFDGLIAVFDAKYTYTFWRPETAIRAGDTDNNPKTDPDPGFVPFITAPCHPSYPSAHAAQSNAARAVLERLYGRRGHSITLTTPSLPDVTLHYTSLEEITDDIDDARVYGGIHYRFDQRAGTEMGERVGRYVHRHNLCRLRGGRHDWTDDIEGFAGKSCK